MCFFAVPMYNLTMARADAFVPSFLQMSEF